MQRLNLLKSVLRVSRFNRRTLFVTRCLLSTPPNSTEIKDKNDLSKSINPESTLSSTKSVEIPIQRESDVRDEILREALRYVEDKGWTLDAIKAGIESLNKPTTLEGLFNNGYDLVDYFINDANKKMSQFMEEKLKKGESEGGQLLIEALKYRIQLVIPYAHVWNQALALGALPQNSLRSWKSLIDLSSSVWHGIGDKSADINWYTKRMIVGAIYKSAEIFMLQDSSTDKIETVQYLERRLKDFHMFGSVRNSVSKSFSDTAQLAGGLFSIVRNLTSRR